MPKNGANMLGKIGGKFYRLFGGQNIILLSDKAN
jgi:hypothetical protein